MADYSGYTTLQVEREDKVLVVTLNRPDSLNAFNPQMHTDVEDLYAKLVIDSDVNAVVITGAGKAFCAGGDVKGMAARSDDTGSRFVRSFTTAWRELRKFRSMLEIEQPIIAAVNGDAVGLGATLALFSDVSIVSENARIGDTHVRVGLVAGDGGAVIWPLLVGVNRAKELLMSANLISASEAERIGLVNRVLPRDEVLPAAKELAHRLANGPIWAIKWTKVSVNKVVREKLDQILDTSLALETLSMLTEDHAEAAKAFGERRTPKFLGR